MLIIEEDHPFALAYRLVEEGKIDPWNVDIVELANIYLQEIKKAELLDIRIPARAVLAASFLLKKKMEILFPQPKKKIERKRLTLEEIVELFEEENPKEETFIPPTQEKDLKQRPSIRKRVTKRSSRRTFPIHTSKFEDALEEIMELIGKGVGLFRLSSLVNGKSVVPYLMALMVLYYEGKVDVYQDGVGLDLEVRVL